MPQTSRSFVLCLLAACAGCAPLLRGDLAGATTVKVESPVSLTCAADAAACEIDMHITLSTAGNCVLTLPGTVEVRGRGIDRKMNWTLIDDSPVEEFRIKSFTFTDDTSPPQFVRQVLNPSRMVFSAFNLRTVLHRDFHYAIELEHRPAAGGAFRSCGADPVIVNKG